MATVYNLEIEQGSSFEKVFLVRNQDGSSPDMTGWTARMQFRSIPSSSVVEMNATNDNGKLLINLGNSSVTISLTANDTASLVLVKYYYDIELVKLDNKILRLVQGAVNINREITRD